MSSKSIDLAEAVKNISKFCDNNIIDSNIAAKLIAKLVPKFLSYENYNNYFSYFENQGFHLSPVHFYHPIPNTALLPDEIWTKCSELAGIDMNKEGQLDLLTRIFPEYKNEYINFPLSETKCPYEFFLNNKNFDGHDALVLHCMIRHFLPKRIIECGSGFSTRISANAALMNGSTQLICIEPYASDLLKSGFPGITQLNTIKLEDIPLDFFKCLESNDILFIDTSHVVRLGGDVNYIYLDLLPSLNDGVIIHIHDIFFPWDYPKNWIFEHHRFWTEQYLLQAFLAFNNSFRTMFCNSYMAHYFPEQMKSIFPNAPCGGSSFWMQRQCGVR